MERVNKKKVVITGSKGCIGSIVKSGIRDADLYFLDIKEKNSDNTFKIDIAKEFNKLVKIFRGKDIIFHLAWDFFEDFPRETVDANNKKMAENIYKGAVEAGVKRIIMASSVHTNDYSKEKKKKNLDTDYPWPDSPYGASKVYIESLGKYYTKYHGLEVICIRFGGVNEKDTPIYKEDQNYDKVLLYKKDCINLINSCINVVKVPDNFQVFTAISKNKNRVHIIKNFLNWKPKLPNKK